MSDLDIFGRFTGRNPSSRCFLWQDWAFPRDYVAGNSRLRDGPGLQGTWVSFMGSVDRSEIKFNKLVIWKVLFVMNQMNWCFQKSIKAGTVEVLLKTLEPSNALVTAGSSASTGWQRLPPWWLDELPKVVSRSCNGVQAEPWYFGKELVKMEKTRLLTMTWIFFLKPHDWRVLHCFFRPKIFQNCLVFVCFLSQWGRHSPLYTIQSLILAISWSDEVLEGHRRSLQFCVLCSH